MFRVILMKNDEKLSIVQFTTLSVAYSTFKWWDKKFTIDEGFYITMERI